jgi:hypothetical protein
MHYGYLYPPTPNLAPITNELARNVLFWTNRWSCRLATDRVTQAAYRPSSHNPAFERRHEKVGPRQYCQGAQGIIAKREARLQPTSEPHQGQIFP